MNLTHLVLFNLKFICLVKKNLKIMILRRRETINSHFRIVFVHKFIVLDHYLSFKLFLKITKSLINPTH